MSALSSMLCLAVLLALLPAFDERALPRDPLDVLALLGGALFIALGFALFGHRRFDEPPGERRDHDPSCR